MPTSASGTRKFFLRKRVKIKKIINQKKEKKKKIRLLNELHPQNHFKQKKFVAKNEESFI
jgi:hypothetical protein